MKTPTEKAIEYCIKVEGQINQPYIDAFLAGYKASNESDENISKVVFFELQNGKYVTKNGKEITIDFLIQHEHVIMNDNGYIVLERN